jgi:hypothetical protein
MSKVFRTIGIPDHRIPDYRTADLVYHLAVSWTRADCWLVFGGVAVSTATTA